MRGEQMAFVGLPAQGLLCGDVIQRGFLLLGNTPAIPLNSAPTLTRFWSATTLTVLPLRRLTWLVALLLWVWVRVVVQLKKSELLM